MSVLFVFLICALVSAINPMLFAWLSSFFMNTEKARVAGFALTVGLFLGEGGMHATSAQERLATLAGVIVGLAFVWFHFFRKKVTNG